MYSEAEVESWILDRLGELEWEKLGVSPVPGAGERESWNDIVLRGRLNQALRNLNPGVPEEYLQQAIAEVITPKSQSAIAENVRLHEILVHGYRGIEYIDHEGQIQNPTIYFFSADPNRNDYVAANQIILRSPDHERRFDVVLFVNGLPLVIMELKKTSSRDDLEHAYNQLKTYVTEFPMAFRFANIAVAASDSDARYGTPFTPFEHFAPWNVDDEGAPVHNPISNVDGEEVTATDLLLFGLFNVERFGQLFTDFTAFDDTPNGLVMRIAKPHQYFAVTKAVGSTVTAMNGDKRAGVVWHTTGAGKSMEMEMYTAKIMRHPKMASPTIIVLNDRTELDQQLYDTFKISKLLPEAPTKIASREELREELTTRASGGIYFSTLQKFGLSGTDDQREEQHPLLSERRNIVVIVDEAHRSHYGFGDTAADGYAQHLRDALPNATMLAFTGTPLRKWDRDTRKVFGDDIDIYDMNRAVKDGAVVPVYFEPRLIPLARIPGITDDALDAAAEEALEGLDELERQRIQQSVAVLELIYGADDRLETLADDLIRHWEDRRENMSEFLGGHGKALVVTATRSIAAKLYEKIVAQRPDWHDDADDKGKIKVIYSAAPTDPDELKVHMRRPNALAAVKNRVKNVDDELEIAIVQGMMLTGFDAKALHTLYIDRPLKDALLMQTLARVNRTYRNKQDGLLVAYAPLVDNLNAALKEFTYDAANSGKKIVGENIEEALELTRVFLAKLETLVGGAWRTTMKEQGARKAILDVVASLRSPQTPNNYDPEKPDARPLAMEFKVNAGKLARAWALASGSDDAEELREDVRFYSEVKVWLTKLEAGDRVAKGEPVAETVKNILGKLVIDSTESTGVIDVYREAGIDIPNLQDLDAGLIKKETDESKIALLIDGLRRSLQQEAREATGNNEIRSKQFSERIAELMNRYTNQQLTSAQIIAELIELSKEVVAEHDRGSQFEPALSNDELAFYDVVSLNESAVNVMGTDVLADIARDLVATMRRDVRTDWTARDDVKAKLRRTIKRLLRKYGYPPDQTKEAISEVYNQMERFAPRFAEEAGMM
jgi:type I site-specific deoxyribonuclease, hsdR family